MTKWQPNIRFCECGDHAFAPITKGYSVMVSPDDAHHLMRPWRAHISKRGYVTVLSSNGGKHILARKIAEPKPHLIVDHRSGITLDNRRANLRECTRAQNAWNSRRRKTNGLPLGVQKTKTERYLALIQNNWRVVWLGTYSTAEEAANAYRTAALEFRGEFARVE